MLDQADEDIIFTEILRLADRQARKGESELINSGVVFRELRQRWPALELRDLRPVISDARDRGFIRVKDEVAGGDLRIFTITGSGREFLRTPEAKLAPAREGIDKLDTEPRSVFVIHGQNERAKEELFVFLKEIDLKPTAWSKAVEMTKKSSPYVSEIVRTGLDKAQAIIALFTDDEEVTLRANLAKGRDDSGYQPRPNVIFEAGWAFGQYPDKTIFVEMGSLRPISDIAGIHTIRLDDSFDRRRDLAQRLKGCGCPVDIDHSNWDKAGKFKEAVDHSPKT